MAETDANPKSETSDNKIVDIYANKTESTFLKSPFVPETFNYPYNPDDLYQKTMDYSIYEDMILDDQVSVCLQLKKDLVIGSGWDIMPGDEGQDEIIEDIEIAINEDISTQFGEAIEEILTAYDFGFSLTEKIFTHRDDGTLTIKKLATRHPASWLIHLTDQGDIEKYIQRTSQGDKEIDPNSLIHFINTGRFQNPYGVSDLRTAYAAWFAKKQIVKYFAIFLEKAASPTPVARYDKNAPQSAVDKIFTVIKKFQAKTAIAIPKDIEIEFLEAKNNGEAYHKAINLFNMFIGRSLFVPDLIGMQGSETGGGSYSLGKEQIGIFFQHINRRRATLERIINKEIIWPIVAYNWGFIDNYPKFRFKPLDDTLAIESAKIWLDAVKGKAFTPNDEEINHFRKLVKFPEGEVIEAAQPVNPLVNPMDQSSQLEDGQEAQSGNTAPEQTDEVTSPEPPHEMPPEMMDEKTYGKIYNLPPGDYYKKVDFKAIEVKLKAYQNSILEEARPIIKKIYADLFDQLDKKKILQSQKPERLDTLKLKYLKELKQILKESFRQLYQESQTVASQEILKGNYKKPLNSQQFNDVVEQETYQYVGDWSYDVLKRAKTEMVAALKDGRPLSSVIDVLEADGEDASETSLERYARTKHTEIMNHARLDFFEDSGVVAAYQYSAVLDDRTSEICAGLDGKIFEAGDQPVPPLHFNCRSLLIPITKYEDYTPSEKAKGQPIDTFIEENKGAGFSTNTTKNEPKTEPKKDIDNDIDFETTQKDPVTEIITYSKAGTPFKTTTIVYEDDTRTKIIKLTNERIDGKV